MGLQSRDLEYWQHKGSTDAEPAFRAVIRGFIEGAEGNEDDPANLCAATIFARLVSDDLDGVTTLLNGVVAQANAMEWRAAANDAPSGFLDAYSEGFLSQFLASADAFRSSRGTVGDYLATGSTTDEARWRMALAKVWVAEVPQPLQRTSHGPTRLVVFQYCISLGLVSFKRTSDIKVIAPGSSLLLVGLPYTLISLVAGWWGIPWGPLWTLEAIGRNLSGGIDVTDAVAASNGRMPSPV